MCGIAGIISINNLDINMNKLNAMTDAIAHRGPDGAGHWVSVNGNVGLGHRRLSIIDLSNEADQPMHYADRYTIVFNGEIYNYLELKEILIKQGYQFTTQSDTEVLIALYDRDKENCLAYLDGMFAFVIYDKLQNIAFCARDRFGEKPFFYNYKQGEYFYFGSEMKCLWNADIKKEVNNKMLFNYLSFNYLENPQDLTETFYENCTRLPHSHFIKIDVNSMTMICKKYYDIDYNKIDFSISEKNAFQQLEELFFTSVKRRLRSDVPVGSSLSGGLDSSLVVSVIDEIIKGSNQKQNTFSAVFPGFERDERKYIDYVLNKTNVKPHFVTPNDVDLLKDFKKMAWHQEEPFGSSSIYVQYRVMQLAKDNNVTVLLDGQGADEMLAGYHGYYNSFFKELKKKSKQEFVNQQKKYLEIHSNNKINGIQKTSFMQEVSNSLSGSVKKIIKPIKTVLEHKLNPLFSNDFFNEHKNNIYNASNFDSTTLNANLYNSTYKQGLQQLLRYSDRNSMAHSREVRLPFLSHELVDFIFTLPANFKINDGWTKWIMRKSFNVMPTEIAWRVDKIGYEPPQQKWMENEEVKEMILKGKNKLFSDGILSKNILESPVVAEKQSAINNINWKLMQVSEFF